MATIHAIMPRPFQAACALHGFHLLFAVASFLAHFAAFRTGGILLVQHAGVLLLN